MASLGGLALGASLVAVLATGAIVRVVFPADPATGSDTVVVSSDGVPVPSVAAQRGADGRFPVTIVRDEARPSVLTGATHSDGTPVTIRCGTCHATKTPDPDLKSAAALDLFHQGLAFRHGDLACLACHDAADYDSLKLANGSKVGFEDRQALCVQCHGPTASDYANGAHGGMNGYWDLTKGPRTRLGCTQCHDPHAPAYPQMSRTFFTRDRFVGDRTGVGGGPGNGPNRATPKDQEHRDG